MRLALTVGSGGGHQKGPRSPRGPRAFDGVWSL